MASFFRRRAGGFAFVKLLAAILLYGCVAPVSKYPPPKEPKVVMHGDQNFSDAERKTIMRAAETWRDQTDGLADIHIVWDYTEEHPSFPAVLKVTGADPEVFYGDCMATGGRCLPVVLGQVFPAGGIHTPWKADITLKLVTERFDSEAQLFSVTLHEMGHIFGVSHLNQPQAVMYPAQLRNSVCLTKPDLTAFCSVNECEGYRMKPCEEPASVSMEE